MVDPVKQFVANTVVTWSIFNRSDLVILLLPGDIDNMSLNTKLIIPMMLFFQKKKEMPLHVLP